ncbi:MAG: hypothetical protein ABIK68_03075 [bacterium]
MKLTNRSKMILVLLALGLAMLSCSEVLVENNAVMPVRVTVLMPGWQSMETKLLNPGESYMFQGDESGTYRVRAILDEDYIQSFKQFRDEMALLLVANSDTMTSKQLQTKVKELENFSNFIDKIKSVYCHGLVDDEFTPSVKIFFERANDTWSITCE